MDKQTVFEHIMTHMRKEDKPNYRDTSWRVIHKNIGYDGERKCIEAIEIQKHSGKLMNGCFGRVINV